MTRIEYLKIIASLFNYKTVIDNQNNEFVLLKSSPINKIQDVTDKTEFEANENHVHLVNHVRKNELFQIINIADNLGNAVLSSLKYYYPNKHFMVYVTVRLYDSLIVRFHQKWSNEEPYYNPSDFIFQNEKVFLYEE